MCTLPFWLGSRRRRTPIHSFARVSHISHSCTISLHFYFLHLTSVFCISGAFGGVLWKTFMFIIVYFVIVLFHIRCQLHSTF